MFTVIYSFVVKPNQEDIFINAWRELTRLIYQYEGSLGSRLHKLNENNYIAYAQWPNKLAWENVGNKLPAASEEIKNTMRKACEKIETLYELEVIEDLLMQNSFKEKEK